MMTKSNQTWRLLQTPASAGAWNMGVDEAILMKVTVRESPPTLRLYDWVPPCLSLGYAQTISDVDHRELVARGWQLVRRPTGGRAILHTDELTYSVIGQEDNHILAGDILTSYQRLSAAILQALGKMGLPVTALPKEDAPTGPQIDPVCFEVPSNYEITAGGKKLVGSAQARRKGGVLQHGTLPLYGDLARITEVLVFESEKARTEAARRLLTRATTVEAVLGERLSWAQAAEAFVLAFSETLDILIEPGELSPQEEQLAEELIQKKYGNPDWTRRN
jgi:lipoate-protein ligase A